MNSLMVAFVKGLIFGITLAAIPGPIFFLMVQRTLTEGPLIGFVCGLGAITVDAVYATIAAIGLTVVSHFLIEYQQLLTIVGGIILLYLGYTTFIRRIALHSAQAMETGLIRAYLSTFFLTLMSPITIMSYAVFFAGLGIDTTNSLTAAAILVGGVIAGVILVTLLLVGFCTMFRQTISSRAVVLINKVAGLLLIGFGFMALVSPFCLKQ